MGTDFVSVTEAIDTSTPAGKMVFTVLGAVAQLERSIICERVIAVQNAARRRGAKFGRPIVAVDAGHVIKLRKDGLSWRAIAAQMGMAEDTLRRSPEFYVAPGFGAARSRDARLLPLWPVPPRLR